MAALAAAGRILEAELLDIRSISISIGGSSDDANCQSKCTCHKDSQ
jgi:hypothetical protein